MNEAFSKKKKKIYMNEANDRWASKSPYLELGLSGCGLYKWRPGPGNPTRLSSTISG